MDKKSQLTIIGAAIILLTVVTITYGYFVSGVDNSNPQTAVIETGTMELTFADNDAGISKQMIFGESIEKKFTLENTGTVETTVDLYWKELVNTYLHGSLMYKLEYATSENGTKSIAVNYSPVPTSETALRAELATQQTVPSGTKYYYTLTITLINSKTIDQTADLQASFASGFDIESVRKYPMLAASDTWYTQGGTTVKRASITSIDIKSSYEPNGTVTSSWDASAAKDGSIMAYVEGTKLTIAGNGAEKIAMNPDSSFVFGDHNKTDYYDNVTTFSDANLLDTSKVTTMLGAFARLSSIKSLDTSNWNTGNVTNFYSAFSSCKKIEELDVSHFNTFNATDMSAMFSGCFELEELDVSQFDTSNVTTMHSLFYYCTSLISVDVSKWDTSKVTVLQSTFAKCSALKNLDVNNWDTSKVTNMYGTFWETGLEELNLSGWNTAKVTNMKELFVDSTNLKKLNLSGWNTTKVTNMSMMFKNTPLLTEIIGIDQFILGTSTIKTDMFLNCGLITVPDWYGA